MSGTSSSSSFAVRLPISIAIARPSFLLLIPAVTSLYSFMISPSSTHLPPSGGLLRLIAATTISPIAVGSTPIPRRHFAVFPPSSKCFATNAAKLFPVVVAVVAIDQEGRKKRLFPKES